MTGKLYGVGVGPGDKELVTIKAVRVLKNAAAVAVPKMKSGSTTAYDIIKDYVGDKEIIFCEIPMTKDLERLNKSYSQIADEIEKRLLAGDDIAFVTLGDPTIYSSYMQIDLRIRQRGYETELIPGVTSFCAAAARLNIPLCERDEPLYVLPASALHTEEALKLKGCKVLMKSGKSIGQVAAAIREGGLSQNTYMVECCGMENEKIYKGLDNIDEGKNYFSVIIVKD